MLGQELLTQYAAHSSTQQVDMSVYPTGIYWLLVHDTHGKVIAVEKVEKMEEELQKQLMKECKHEWIEDDIEHNGKNIHIRYCSLCNCS